MRREVKEEEVEADSSNSINLLWCIHRHFFHNFINHIINHLNTLLSSHNLSNHHRHKVSKARSLLLVLLNTPQGVSNYYINIHPTPKNATTINIKLQLNSINIWTKELGYWIIVKRPDILSQFGGQFGLIGDNSL